MAVIYIEGDYEYVDCFEFKPDDVVGYRFNYDQLAQFAKWLAENTWRDSHIVLGEDRIAGVDYDNEQSYIEEWSIRRTRKGGLFKSYNCWVTNPYWSESNKTWYDDSHIVCDIIECFKSLDNIVFKRKPKINHYKDEDE